MFLSERMKDGCRRVHVDWLFGGAVGDSATSVVRTVVTVCCPRALVIHQMAVHEPEQAVQEGW